jgi:HAD superfamily hydrolase (TIGR01509 family)
MSKITTVLFDMDGVLIEAKDWHYEALNDALALIGMEISRYDHLTTFDGLPTRKKLEMLSIERGLPKKLHEFINTVKQQNTAEIASAKCKPIFSHEYALSRLKHEGIKMGVCSNSVRSSVKLMMEKSMLEPYLSILVSNEDVSNAKPDPEMYIKAMEFLKSKPEETLILEDNEHGKKAAIASGAHLLEIGTVHDVNYFNIANRIKEIESQ